MNRRLLYIILFFCLSAGLASWRVLVAQPLNGGVNAGPALLVTAIKNGSAEKEFSASAQAEGQELVLEINPARETEIRAEVFDITGKQLLNDKLNINAVTEYRISFSAWPEGIYMLKLSNDRSASRIFRVIKSSGHADN